MTCYELQTKCITSTYSAREQHEYAIRYINKVYIKCTSWWEKKKKNQQSNKQKTLITRNLNDNNSR